MVFNNMKHLYIVTYYDGDEVMDFEPVIAENDDEALQEGLKAVSEAWQESLTYVRKTLKHINTYKMDEIDGYTITAVKSSKKVS